MSRMKQEKQRGNRSHLIVYDFHHFGKWNYMIYEVRNADLPFAAFVTQELYPYITNELNAAMSRIP